MSLTEEALHDRTACRPIETAPKDGTLIRLRMRYHDKEGDYSNPLWDVEQFAWTIGFNQFELNEIDEWQFAGWDWNGDEFEKGSGGVPVGWLPFFHDAVDVFAERALKGLQDADEALREQSDVQGLAARCIAHGIITAYETITSLSSALAAEREACAKVADKHAALNRQMASEKREGEPFRELMGKTGAEMSERIADAIRAGSTTGDPA